MKLSLRETEDFLKSSELVTFELDMSARQVHVLFIIPLYNIWTTRLDGPKLVKRNYFLDFCFVLRSHDGERGARRKRLKHYGWIWEGLLLRRYVSGEGSGQEVAAHPVKEARNQCRLWAQQFLTLVCWELLLVGWGSLEDFLVTYIKKQSLYNMR